MLENRLRCPSNTEVLNTGEREKRRGKNEQNSLSITQQQGRRIWGETDVTAKMEYTNLFTLVVD